MLYFQIDGFFGHRTGFNGGDKVIGIHETPFGHFEVKSGVSRSDSRIYGSPVRHQNTFEAPKIAQDINIQPFMFSGMNAVQKIVAVHYGTHIRFLYGLAESRKINFMQSTLVYVRAGMMTAPFLIVGDKVLDGGNDSFRLHAQDILFGSLAC